MATTLSKISGDGQQGSVGQPLANPFVVEVQDQNGNPLAGTAVTFAVTAGGGTLRATTPTTDANGQAQTTLTLGDTPGTNTVEVTVEGVSETVTFNAEASLPPPTPTAPSIISGGDQEGLTGETAMDPLVVEVIDQYGNPISDVTVTFTVTGGDGMLNDTVVTTDANGRAETTLTLGNVPGPITVEASVEGVAATVTFTVVAKLLEFELSLPIGINLIHIPLKVRAIDGIPGAIESVSDLYDVLGGVAAVNFLITHDPESQEWRAYFGEADRGGIGDAVLTDHTGIIVSAVTPISVRLGGDALGMDGTATVTLHQGLNFVGLPLRDPRLVRVSDLFAVEGVADNVDIIVVTADGTFRSVSRAGDVGDIEITGGQSFILIAQQSATIPISGNGWDNTAADAMAAPPLTRVSVQTAGITPVLTLSGAVVDEANHINSAGLRVSVKNLSTGHEVGDTRITSPRGGYRLTVVDIESGRVASIGDTLEISVTSPDTAIGVDPLRYTVTPEDVRRSRIELPALLLQEIPTQTKLLANYPNPFNPETWIPYQLAEDAFVTLAIYDGSGRLVRTLDVGHRVAAIYESRSKAIYWDGRNAVGEQVASGVYFYHLKAGDYSAMRRMVILK